MGFFKRFFGGKSESSEDKKEDQSAKDFEVLKYDGVRAMHQGQMDYAIKCLTNALLAKQVDEEIFFLWLLSRKVNSRRLMISFANCRRLNRIISRFLFVWLR